MTIRYGEKAEMLSKRIDNVLISGSQLDTKTFRKSLKLINPYEDVLEGKRTLKDMAKYGYDNNDFQAMRIFRYNLMKGSLRVNTMLDLFIGLMNIISLYLIIIFGSLNVNFLNKVFSWIVNKPIENTFLFNIPVLSNVNFFIGFSVLYFSVIFIEFFKIRLAKFTGSEICYGKDIKSFFTIGQLGAHTFLFMSYLYDIIIFYKDIIYQVHLHGFNLIYSVAGIVVAIIVTVNIKMYLRYLDSLFKKIEIIIGKNGITPPSPITEELIQKHKYMIYNDKNIQNINVGDKATTVSKSSKENTIGISKNNIVEITPDHLIRKRQQEIYGDLSNYKSRPKENTKSEENKVIDINKNKVKRRARF